MACSAQSNILSPECNATSIGTATQLFTTLVQTLMIAQCSIPSAWPRDYGKVAVKEGLSDYDFVVIGAGSAGAIVAARLAEITTWKILLLEAGGDPPVESEVPGLFLSLYQNNKTDWAFYGKALRACKLSPSGCYMPRGKMLGGSSSVNFMHYVRGAKAGYDEWANLSGGPGWSYDNVLPYFKKSEGNQNATLVAYQNGKYHSATGPLKVQSAPASGFGLAIENALRASGLNFLPEINAEQILGYTELQLTSANGKRSSTAKSFLSPARNRRNLHVIKHAYVTKILINKYNVAYGVEFKYKNRKMKAYVKKEVIVSAGTIQSPPLLMRSGIGPKAHLHNRNIKCKADLPVGANYIDHVVIQMVFQFNVSSTPLPPTFSLDSWYQYIKDGTGPLSSSPYVSGFQDTTNSSNGPNIQLFFSNFPRGTPAETLALFSAFLNFPAFNPLTMNVIQQNDINILTVGLINPKSRGFIRLSKCPYCKKPDIFTNYLEHPDDRAALIAAIKYHMNIRQSSAFKAIGNQFLRPPIPECDALQFPSDAYWDCYITYASISGTHQTGTSSMGAVVDQRLKVFGIKGLRQIDAGIIPVSIRGNTNAASMMVGEKGADLIKEDYFGTVA